MMNCLVVRPNSTNATIVMTDANGRVIHPSEIVFNKLHLFDNGITTSAAGYLTVPAGLVRRGASYGINYIYQMDVETRDFKLVGCKITDIRESINGNEECAFEVNVGQFRGSWNLKKDKEPDSNE